MQPTSTIFFLVFILMIGCSLLKPWFSKDKSEIWSPITFIALTMIYYVVLPSFEDMTLYGAGYAPNQYMFYLCADVFYGVLLYAFSRKTKSGFKKWNNLFTLGNVQTIAVILFVIAMICYVPFRGFRTTISANDATIVTARIGLVSYFIDLISLFVGASCLAFVGLKSKQGLGFKKWAVILIILYFTLVMFIVGGFRYRLVILILALATTYHLFPCPRKINYVVLIPVAIVAYLGFAIMDSSRRYGTGIDMEVAKNISLSEASQGAGESSDVYCFSIATIDHCSRFDDYVGFEPILTAVLMPIPRAFFPWKPDGHYLRDIQLHVIGDSASGAAFLVFAEAYMAFGMIGVILYAFFIGWFLKKVWSNYQTNKDSIGAILLLALVNGFCYTWMSRGYMASAFNDFIYFVVLPFWITQLINKFIKAK